VQLRWVQPADLSVLCRAATETAWQQLTADQRVSARPEAVAAQAQRMVYGVLTAPGGGAVVADWAGRVVGYLLFRVAPGELTGEPEAFFVDIWVEPGLRRHGLGQRLVAAAEQAVAARGARRVQLVIAGANVASHANAHRTGYQPERVVYGKPLGAPAMAPPLASAAAGIPPAGT
jgi:ribosomal protein S18 acetylase RimI-like enzyme